MLDHRAPCIICKNAVYRSGGSDRLQRRNFEMLPRRVRDGFRKTKAVLELRLARGVRLNKSFYTYNGSKG